MDRHTVDDTQSTAHIFNQRIEPHPALDSMHRGTSSRVVKYKNAEFPLFLREQ